MVLNIICLMLKLLRGFRLSYLTAFTEASHFLSLLLSRLYCHFSLFFRLIISFLLFTSNFLVTAVESFQEMWFSLFGKHICDIHESITPTMMVEHQGNVIWGTLSVITVVTGQIGGFLFCLPNFSCEAHSAFV